MEKVKIFCVMHNIDGNYFSNYVVGVSKEDVRERYGNSLDIKKITQWDIGIDMMQVIDALIDGGLSIAQCDVIVSLIDRSLESVT